MPRKTLQTALAMANTMPSGKVENGSHWAVSADRFQLLGKKRENLRIAGICLPVRLFRSDAVAGFVASVAKHWRVADDAASVSTPKFLE